MVHRAFLILQFSGIRHLKKAIPAPSSLLLITCRIFHWDFHLPHNDGTEL